MVDTVTSVLIGKTFPKMSQNACSRHYSRVLLSKKYCTCDSILQIVPQITVSEPRLHTRKSRKQRLLLAANDATDVPMTKVRNWRLKGHVQLTGNFCVDLPDLAENMQRQLGAKKQFSGVISCTSPRTTT